MNYKHLLFTAAILAPLASIEASYEGAMERLSTGDPEFVFHANLEADFDRAGAILSDLYLASMLQGSPDFPPIPVDFGQVFGRLGLANLASITLVSGKSANGGFLNQSLFLFDGAPSGVFHLAGRENKPFSILNDAPADADLIAEFYFDGPVLFDIARGLMIDAMGPVGEGLLEMQMSQPLNDEGLTFKDLVNRMQTRAQLAVRMEDPSTGMAGFAALLNGKSVVRLSGLGDLLPTLAPFLQQAGFVQEGGVCMAQLPVPGVEGGVKVVIEALADSNDLMVCLSDGAKDWFMSNDQPAISSPGILKAIAGFPDTGLAIWYSSARIAELQLAGLDQGAAGNPQAAGLLPILRNLLMEFSGPQSGVTFLEADAYRTVNWQPTSFKTNLVIAGIALPVGIAAGIAEEAAKEAPASPAE
jgi:hypothetical protein